MAVLRYFFVLLDRAVDPVKWRKVMLVKLILNRFKIPYISIIGCFLLWLCIAFAAKTLGAEPTASEIIHKVENLQRGNTSQSRMQITIERPRFKRTMILDSWDDKKGNRFFLRLLKPKKDKGITFLKVGNNLWQYIPKIGKEIKIEGSLMQDSWMGSDFTNDDLVKTSSIEKDYVHSFLPGENKDYWKIQLVPKPEAAVIWSRIVSEIRKSDLMPVSHKFFDHKNRLRKLQKFSDYKIMGGRKIPVRFEMHTLKNGKIKSRTTLNFLRARFNHLISDQIFSRANLRR